jgi:hypothetical protein
MSFFVIFRSAFDSCDVLKYTPPEQPGCNSIRSWKGRSPSGSGSLYDMVIPTAASRPGELGSRVLRLIFLLRMNISAPWNEVRIINIMTYTNLQLGLNTIQNEME